MRSVRVPDAHIDHAFDGAPATTGAVAAGAVERLVHTIEGCSRPAGIGRADEEISMSASPYVLDVNEADFAGSVIERSHCHPVVVDFWAEPLCWRLTWWRCASVTSIWRDRA